MKGTVIRIYGKEQEETIYDLPDVVRINDEVACVKRVSSSNHAYAVFQEEPAEVEVIELSDMEEDVLTKAQQFSIFRNSVKKYLQDKELCFDKFTVTEEDTILGYISEKCVSEYINRKYGEDGIQVSTWQDLFDMKRIASILRKNSDDQNDKAYVKRYFYDKYDLKLSKGDKAIAIDVKSAATDKEPMKYWTYLYPVVQAGKEGKEGVVLAYCIKNKAHVIEKVSVCGYLSEERIKECSITPKGTITGRGTKSQIDNYTSVVKDYERVDEFIRRKFS